MPTIGRWSVWGRMARPVTGLGVVLGLVLGLALSLTAGCGGGSTENTTTYTNADYGFSLEYDGELFTETQDTTATGEAGSSSAFQIGFFDDGGTREGGAYRDGATIAVYQLAAPVDESSLPEFRDFIENRLMPELDTSFASGVTFTEVAEIEISGARGFVTEAAYEMDGTPFKATMYFLLSGDLEYQITLQAIDDRWSEMQPAFEQIIDTFSIEGAAPSP